MKRQTRFKATLPAMHENAYAGADDRVRCGECGHLPEPCAKCKAMSAVLAAMTRPERKS